MDDFSASFWLLIYMQILILKASHDKRRAPSPNNLLVISLWFSLDSHGSTSSVFSLKKGTLVGAWKMLRAPLRKNTKTHVN